MWQWRRALIIAAQRQHSGAVPFYQVSTPSFQSQCVCDHNLSEDENQDHADEELWLLSKRPGPYVSNHSNRDAGRQPAAHGACRMEVSDEGEQDCV